MRFGDEDTGVTVAMEQGVATVRLDRPAKLNALNLAMFDAIEAVIAHLGTLADLRCVVLAGEGRSFCVGIDLAVLAGGGTRAAGPAQPWRGKRSSTLRDRMALASRAGDRRAARPLLRRGNADCAGRGPADCRP